MAGIYFHIPFCKQACNYCDFHFSTSLKYKTELIEAIKMELRLRKHEIQEQPIQTIYFGGGTPSLLSIREIESIFEELQKHTSLENILEITFEANPDNLSKSYLKELFQSPINRLSIGIQSFFNEDLSWMNRSHNAKEAIASIQNAQDIGFSNINVDLIYGSPTTSDKHWEDNLKTWHNLELSHLSAYNLTVEEKTSLHTQIEKGKLDPISDKKGEQQFQLLLDFVDHHNLHHYEISNLARDKQSIAIHNTAYWQNKAYIGIGPSAHSFNGKNKRLFNPPQNLHYIEAIKNKTRFYKTELLTEIDRYNEYILTRIRMKEGINKSNFTQWNHLKSWNKIIKEASQFICKEQMVHNQLKETLLLTNTGKKFADSIAMSLMIVD